MKAGPAILGAALTLWAGCKDDVPPAVERVTQAAAAADQSLSALEPTAPEPFQAQACHRGDAEGLDVLVCVYPTEEAASTGLETIRKALAATALTTVARRKGLEVVAISDRDRVDLKGRRIQALLEALDEQPAAAEPPP